MQRDPDPLISNSDQGLPLGRSPQGDEIAAPFITDSALKSLKSQSADGCILCAFDAWDSEEWD
jgi:hypothetical protein